jgi:thiosulfate dehydrogenase [quinone] large subunit
MFFAGIEKVLDPAWTAKGFLLSAKTFPEFYAWFAEPINSWWIDPLNAWGIALVGVALLLGVAVRPAAWAGAVLMFVYYFPHNVFPEVPHGFIVEEHIIYAAAFILVAALPVAQRFGLSSFLRQTFLGRIPIVRSLI